MSSLVVVVVGRGGAVVDGDKLGVTLSFDTEEPVDFVLVVGAEIDVLKVIEQQ